MLLRRYTHDIFLFRLWGDFSTASQDNLKDASFQQIELVHKTLLDLSKLQLDQDK